MTNNEIHIKYITVADKYSSSEWAAQLSEECAELSKAASKFRRVADPNTIMACD